MSIFKNVNVVSVHVRNWEEAKKFYRETLEWPVAWSGDEVGWEEYGVENATHVAINRWESLDALPVNGPIPVLLVDDPYAVTETLRARGVKCEDVVNIPGVVTYGTFFDPEGNRWQFVGGM
jgi:predicted enzyme related to lactoylglutathione lyase